MLKLHCVYSDKEIIKIFASKCKADFLISQIAEFQRKCSLLATETKERFAMERGLSLERKYCDDWTGAQISALDQLVVDGLYQIDYSEFSELQPLNRDTINCLWDIDYAANLILHEGSIVIRELHF